MNGLGCLLIVGVSLCAASFLLIWGLCRASATSAELDNLTVENDGDFLA